MYKVVSTDTFNKCLRKLRRGGKKGIDAIRKSLAAQAETANDGAISLKLTNHGESRLKNVSKYDLGDGYRLVVQNINEKEKTYAFLYVGDHEDTERWLNNHKNYQWIKSKKDNTLQFVQISVENEKAPLLVEPDLESSDELLELPLLRKLTSADLTKFKISKSTLTYIFGVTGLDWERDSSGIIEYLEKNEGSEIALFLLDLLTLSHAKEYDKLPMRIKLQSNEADLPSEKVLSEAISDPLNNEIIVTWEEIETIPEDSSWSEWLLFLHPEQKKIAKSNFNGASRLRGVSGSGKTCVMLHRARYLAIKYKKPILLITLTESMRKLLDVLIKDLCGVESSFIHTLTVNMLGERIINGLHPKGTAASTKPSGSDLSSNDRDTVNFIKSHDGYGVSQLRNMNESELKNFMNDEYNYVLSRLALAKLDIYLDTKQFIRRGRGIRLTRESRQVCYDAIKYKLSLLFKARQLDYNCNIQGAKALLTSDQDSLKILGWDDINMTELKERGENKFSPYRCVLVDEVQDLSQLEIEMIANLSTGKGQRIKDMEDGLFLVGDGAQTIYNKGFVLKTCGVSVANRSYILKKNYRNSYEIMRAAYSLIEKYEYADVDEDNIRKPMMPDFPNRVGEKPFIVKCQSFSEEIDFIVSRVKLMITDYQQLNDTTGYPEICIIGLNKKTRNIIQQKFQGINIACNELRDTLGVDKKSISISTIESAKGHEFQIVFIANVVASMIPRSEYEDNLAREASRLYVAMTRAREQLYISYSIEGNNTPTPFLMDIQMESNEFEYNKGELKSVD